MCLGTGERNGSVTVVGAVSPPGGDFSEPITQNTLRVVGTFWALDTNLAYRRHFPSVNWIKSYSLYLDSIARLVRGTVARDWRELREKAMYLLQKEVELQEIVQLVGPDALPGERESDSGSDTDDPGGFPPAERLQRHGLFLPHGETVPDAQGDHDLLCTGEPRDESGRHAPADPGLPLRAAIGRMKEIGNMDDLQKMIGEIRTQAYCLGGGEMKQAPLLTGITGRSRMSPAPDLC